MCFEKRENLWTHLATRQRELRIWTYLNFRRFRRCAATFFQILSSLQHAKRILFVFHWVFGLIVRPFWRVLCVRELCVVSNFWNRETLGKFADIQKTPKFTVSTSYSLSGRWFTRFCIFFLILALPAFPNWFTEIHVETAPCFGWCSRKRSNATPFWAQRARKFTRRLCSPQDPNPPGPKSAKGIGSAKHKGPTSMFVPWVLTFIQMGIDVHGVSRVKSFWNI